MSRRRLFGTLSIVALSVVLLAVASSSAQAARSHKPLREQEVFGHIDEDTTWTEANSPYVVTGNVTVDAGVTLTIEPGVVVKFAPDVGVTIETTATLHAQGTAGAPIILTALADDEAGGDTNLDGDQTGSLAGDWNGIIAQGTGKST